MVRDVYLHIDVSILVLVDAALRPKQRFHKALERHLFQSLF